MHRIERSAAGVTAEPTCCAKILETNQITQLRRDNSFNKINKITKKSRPRNSNNSNNNKSSISKSKSKTTHTKSRTTTNTSLVAISAKVQRVKPNPRPIFTIATINGRTIDSDAVLQNFINRLSEKRLDIVALQEFHRRKEGSAIVKSLVNDETYEVHWVGTGPKNKFSGVGFAFRKSLNLEVLEEPEAFSSRVMSVTVRIRGQVIKLVNGYSPTNIPENDKKKRAEKQTFYRNMKKAIKATPDNASKKSLKKTQLAVLGDFNAKISAASYNSHLSYMNVDKIPMEYSENGELLLDLIKDNQLVNLNTAFTHKKAHRETRINPNPNHANQIIDYINVSPHLSKSAINCRVYNRVIDATLSDHRILIAKFKVPASRKERQKFKVKNKQQVPKADPIMKLNKEAVKNPQILDNFIKELATTDINTENSLATLNHDLVGTIKKAALNTIPTIPKKSKVEAPWTDDDELQGYFRERKVKIINKEKINPINKKIKARLRFLENNYYYQQAMEINVLHEQRQVEKEFKKVKEVAAHSMFKPITSAVSCSVPKLKAHFQQHFNLDPLPSTLPPELQNPPPYITKLKEIGQYETVNQNPPTYEEIENCISKMKNNKAASDIPADFLKVAAEVPKIIEVLVEIFKKAWEGAELPADWGMAKIECLYKNKGKKTDPKMYRGLSITSTISKLYMMIIVERLSPWYNKQLDNSQNGFRKGVGTIDAILRNKTIQRLAVKTGQEVYTTFIDLSAAFDTVVRSWIFQAMRVRVPDGQSTKLIDLLETFYSSTSAYLKLDPTKTGFSTNLGVRQGGVESPFIFCMYLDHVMRVYEHKLTLADIQPPVFKYGIYNSATNRAQRYEHPSSGQSTEGWNGYADDTTLHYLSAEDQQKGLEILSEIYQTYYLKLNVGKTETMIYNCQTAAYPESTVSLNDKLIANNETFRFLGSMINRKEIGTGNVELNNRISSAKGKFYEYKKVLQNPRVNILTKMVYFNALIRSRLTYACSSWHLTEAQFNKIDAAQRKMLRQMIGREAFARKDVKKGNWDYKISSQRLLERCKTTNVSDFIRDSQVKLAGHIIRAENDTKNKQLLFNINKNIKTGHKIPNLLITAAANSQKCQIKEADLDQFCRDQRRDNA